MTKKYIFILILIFLMYCPNSFAIKYNQEAIDSLKRIISNSNIIDTNTALAYSSLGMALSDKSIDEGLIFAQKGYELSEKLNFKHGLINSCISYGVCLNAKADYLKALEYYYQALNLFEKYKDNNIKANIYNNMGAIYSNLGDYDKALNNYLLALDLYSLDKNIPEPPMLKGNIGIVYIAKGDYKKAYDYINQSIENNKKINNTHNLAKNYTNLGLLFKTQNNYDKAIDCYDSAITYSAITKSKLIEMVNYSNKGEAYYLKAIDSNNKLAKALKKNLLNKSLEFSLKAETIGKDLNTKRQLNEIYFNIANTLKKLGFWEKALLYTELSQKYKDSIFNEENNLKINNLDRQWNNKILQKDADSFKLERNLTIVILSLSIFIIIVLLFFFLKIKKANTKLNNQNAKISEASRELELLLDNLSIRERELSELNISKDKFISIIAHDINNPLHSISLASEFLFTHYHKLKPEQVKNSISSIRNSSSNLTDLLQTLLQWGRAQRDQLEFTPIQINLKALSDNIIMLFNEKCEG